MVIIPSQNQLNASVTNFFNNESSISEDSHYQNEKPLAKTRIMKKYETPESINSESTYKIENSYRREKDLAVDSYKLK